MKTDLTTFETMTSDLRGEGWGLIKNFITEKHRITTRIGKVDASSPSLGITQYCFGKWTDGLWYVFGWGVDSGSNTGAWYKFDISNNTWITPATFSGAIGARNDDIAFHFEGKFYGYGVAKLSKWTPASAFDANWFASGYLIGSSWTYISEPVIVGANAYFAMDNKVYELATGATSLTLKYTLSTDRWITSLSPTGTSLSVMTYHEGEQKSREFLFNVGGSDTNAYESIDWGGGKVKHHKEIRSVIIAIVDERTNQAGQDAEASIKLKRRSGSEVVTDHEIKCDIDSLVIGNSSRVFEEKLCCKVSFDTPLNENIAGVLGYARNGAFTVELTNEFDANNTAAYGFLPIYNSWFVAHSLSGSNVTTSIFAPFTGSTTLYDGVLQTKIIHHDDSSIDKELLGVMVSFEPLPSNAYVKLYYKIVGESDWTLLTTESTENASRLAYVNSSSHTNKVKDYREIQFQLRTKNAVVTSFHESSVPIKKQPYDSR